jgi:hypothetical protein
MAPNGVRVELPVIVNIQGADETGQITWTVEASVDLRHEHPVVVQLSLESHSGLDLAQLQATFRWSTPLEIVTITLPLLVERGIDPFTYEFPTHGYPDAAFVDAKPGSRLTDEFLREIAGLYLNSGRGYARRIAALYSVSPRTVVGWVEKARARGILSRTSPGVAGGMLMNDRVQDAEPTDL